jgi:cobalt-zinc-cadmium efflux system membrane fusion protein
MFVAGRGPCCIDKNSLFRPRVEIGLPANRILQLLVRFVRPVDAPLVEPKLVLVSSFLTMMNRLRTLFTVFLIAAAVAWGVWHLWPGMPQHDEQVADDSHAPKPQAATVEESAPTSVTMPPEKVAAMNLSVAPVERRTMRRSVQAPGRLQYDDTRHVEIKTASAGVLVEVRVKPGDRVDSGAIVAVVSSPEVGTARADVLQHEADLKIAQELRDWKQATCDGLKQLDEAVRSGKPLEELRRDFQGIQIGAAREQILSAFGKYTLARSTVDSIQSAAESGAIPQRTYQDALNGRDTAAAALDSVLEQLRFDSQQQCREAANAAADAERRLQVSRQHLRTLLGFVGELSKQEISVDPEANLSLVEVHAPFAGTIERKQFSASERVEQGDSLFVLADTSTLWISADLREREWEAARLLPGDTLKVTFPVFPTEEFQAKVYFVGREVDPGANALPLMAVIENPEGRLRPGLFAQIILPVGDSTSALAVPASALSEHLGQKFVFCPENETTFRRVTVQTGMLEADWAEVTEGLTEGTSVVTSGCFELKSELLLERETE